MFVVHRLRGVIQLGQIFLYPAAADAKELVGARRHVDQVSLALSAFLVHELVNRIVLGHRFQQAVHHQKKGLAQLWRTALGSADALS